MYARDPATGHLRHLSSNASPRGRGDGPRHVKVHPNGKILYCVTEHSKFSRSIFLNFAIQSFVKPTLWMHTTFTRHLSPISLHAPSFPQFLAQVRQRRPPILTPGHISVVTPSCYHPSRPKIPHLAHCLPLRADQLATSRDG